MRSSTRERLGPILDGQTRDADHMLDVRCSQDRTSRERVRGNCSIKVLDPLAPLLQERLYRAEALAHVVGPLDPSKLRPQEVEALLKGFLSPRLWEACNPICNFGERRLRHPHIILA